MRDTSRASVVTASSRLLRCNCVLRTPERRELKETQTGPLAVTDAGPLNVYVITATSS
jgi:hypothetical protein